MKAVVIFVNYGCQGPQKLLISIYFSLISEKINLFLLDKFLISIVAETLQIWSSDTEIAHQIWPRGSLFRKNAFSMSINIWIILPLPCSFFHLFMYFHILFLVNSYTQLRNYQQCNTNIGKMSGYLKKWYKLIDFWMPNYSKDFTLLCWFFCKKRFFCFKTQM